MELYCPEGGTVIDPFLGSGTTLLIAQQTGRTCIGGELNPDYCWEMIGRFQSRTGETAVKA
jgi:DNA modification methylase